MDGERDEKMQVKERTREDEKGTKTTDEKAEGFGALMILIVCHHIETIRLSHRIPTFLGSCSAKCRI
ncbi:unnamed protein product [Cylicostephanus goldi]|uniref:Uncharacterized protein n=1 Tax=Cylicostephanus goldi TaxID=71465 RepID=A0A3P7NNM5_CYLGO|nr:unnamed protein product [Cylicostephanus goldi]